MQGYAMLSHSQCFAPWQYASSHKTFGPGLQTPARLRSCEDTSGTGFATQSLTFQYDFMQKMQFMRHGRNVTDGFAKPVQLSAKFSRVCVVMQGYAMLSHSQCFAPWQYASSHKTFGPGLQTPARFVSSAAAGLGLQPSP